jgi:putative endonuclease
MATQTRIAKGKAGENLAADFLLKNGLKVLERNFRCPLGELDIIARDGQVIVFVEVRARVPGPRGYHILPQESIAGKKQRRLVRLAQWYLKQRGLERSAARFDVVGVAWLEDGTPDLNWIVNAFEARG